MRRKTVWVVAVVVVGVVVAWFVMRDSPERRIMDERDRVVEALHEAAPLIAVEGEELGEGSGLISDVGSPPVHLLRYRASTSLSNDVADPARRVQLAVPLLEEAGWTVNFIQDDGLGAQVQKNGLRLTMRPSRDGTQFRIFIQPVDYVDSDRETNRRLDGTRNTFDLTGAD